MKSLWKSSLNHLLFMPGALHKVVSCAPARLMEPICTVLTTSSSSAPAVGVFFCSSLLLSIVFHNCTSRRHFPKSRLLGRLIRAWRACVVVQVMGVRTCFPAAELSLHPHPGQDHHHCPRPRYPLLVQLAHPRPSGGRASTYGSLP